MLMRDHNKGDIVRRDNNAPAGWVNNTGFRAFPCIKHFHSEILYTKVADSAVALYKASGRIRVNPAVFKAELIEHDFTAVAQLKRKPVPAGLLFAKGTCAPLTVEPAQTLYLKPLTFNGGVTLCFQTGLRIIIGSVSMLCALLTEPLIAV